MARRKNAGEGSDRLTKADWVRKATDTLAEKGVSAVRVEVLAKELQVTKGSFYWHFKDRDALLAEVLRHWRDGATGHAEGEAARPSEDPRERIRRLIEFATIPDLDSAPGGRLEQAIREWAVTSPPAAEALRQVDLDRLAMLGQMYIDVGMKRTEASAYAYLLYAYSIGANRITTDVGRQAALSLRQQIVTILTP